MAMKEKKRIAYKIPCVLCRRFTTVEVCPEDLEEFESPFRRNVQDIFPYLDEHEREMFISKICPTCWERLFGGDEE